MKWRWILAASLAGSLICAPALAVDETQQVELLRQVFRLPINEWPGKLREGSGLIDQAFFERVDKRIRWSVDNNQIDDAIRFAMVGDFACDAVGRKGGYRYAMILAFQKNGNDAQALDLIDNVMPTHPTFNEVRFLRANYRRAANEITAAREDYEYLIGQNYRIDDCHYAMGIMFLVMERESEAKKEFALALQANPKHPGALPEMERLNQRVAGGTDLFSDIPVLGSDVKVDPKLHAQYFQEAENELKAAKWGAAEAAFKKAIVANPKEPIYRVNMGALQYRLGRLNDAINILRGAVSLSPKNADAWRFLACSYERQFDTTQSPQDLDFAKKSFEKVLEVRPGDSIAQMSLDRLKKKVPQPKTSTP